MKKHMKKLFIIAAVLITFGILAFTCAMSALDWDFAKLSTEEYEMKRYEISEPFSAISIDTETADVEFLPSEDGKTSVVCYGIRGVEYTAEVEEQTLSIKTRDTRKWYEYLKLIFGTPKITVYLPEGEYGALDVKLTTGDVKIPEKFEFARIDLSLTTGDVTSFASVMGDVKIDLTTGDVKLEKMTCGAASISVTTGDVSLSELKCKSFYSVGSTGDIDLRDVIAEERFDIERTTGDVSFDRCDAGEIKISVTTGDVSGSFLSKKIFYAKSNTGDVDVPRSDSGGICEITSTTGDIEIRVNK